MKSIKSALLVFAACALMAVPVAQSGRVIHKVNATDIGEPGPFADIGEPGPFADIGEPGPFADIGEPGPFADIGEPGPFAHAMPAIV